MNKNIKIVCLGIAILLISATTVFADDGNQANSNMTTTSNVETPTMESGNAALGNTAITGNVAISENITIVQLNNNEVNQVNNFVVNIGVENPVIINAVQVKGQEEKRVKVKDPDTDEVIVVIVNPQGQVKEETQNVVSFTQTINNFIGRHVSFKLVGNTITDYTVEGKLIFQSIDLGFAPTNMKRVGSQLKIFDNTGNHMAIVHDDDEGILTEKSSDQIQAVYKIASDINVKGNEKRIDLSNNIKASILANDPDKVAMSLSGNTANIKLDNNGKSTFIANRVKSDTLDDKIVDGIALSQVGSVITIDSTDSHDITSFDVDTSVLKVVTNTVMVSVNSSTSEGKIIALNVNKDVLKDLNLRVLVDREEIPKAANLDDLFKNDKLSSLIVIGQNVQILVSVPKFSEHQITVTSEGPTATSTVMESPVATTSIPIETATIATTTPQPTQTPKSPGFEIGMILAVITVLYILSKRR